MTSMNPTRPLWLGLLALTLASGPALGQSTSGVADGAGMFSESAVRKAKADLAEVERKHGVSVTVETVDSLKGQTIDEVAIRRAERLGYKGVFVLIAKQEHKAEVLASPRTLFEELGKTRLNEIRDAFTEEFRRNRLDEGLARGVEAAEKVLAAVRPIRKAIQGGGFLPTLIPTGLSSGTSGLVVRQQVRLTLAGARKAIEGGEAKANQAGFKMNIAVVDDGGHLVVFARMDGARPASVATATTKAVSAATYRQPTGPIGVDVTLNLAIQNASGGKITSLLGGVPIVVDGQVIGAIGVGGGSGEQDLEVAKAGLAAFLEGLQAKAEGPKDLPIEGPKDKPAEVDTSPK